MKNFILSTVAVVAMLALAAAPVSAAQFGIIGGLGGLTFAGTAQGNNAHGFQQGGGQAFAITENTGSAAAAFDVNLNTGVHAGFNAASTSLSNSGSLVNGNGDASSHTAGWSVSGSGIVGAGGVAF